MNGIRFLDWQLSRYSSPAVDILYHLFLSTRKSFRDQSFEGLLNVYYDSLDKTVRELGSDPDQLFTFADLKNELNAYGNFCLIMAIFALPFHVAQPDDILDFEEYSERFLKGDRVSLFKNDGKGNATYITALEEVIDDVIGYGYDYVKS